MTKLVLLVVSVAALACGRVNPVADAGSSGDDDDAGPGTDDDAGGTDELELSPPSIDFGIVSIALPVFPRTVTITNHTAASATLQLALSGPDAASFHFQRSSCDAPLAPGATCTIDVALAVGNLGAYAASLEATAGSAHASVTITATAVAAQLTATPSNDDFGDVVLGSTAMRQYTLTNTGDVELPVPSLVLTGDAAYSIGATDCDAVLAPAASCTFTVELHPVAVGPQTAKVTAVSGTLGPEVQLAGRGTSQLSVIKQGSGGGTVTGGGLACGTTCAAMVATTPVTITAAPASGSRFAGWGGAAAACGATAACALPIDTAAVAVSATFDDLPTLTVEVKNGSLAQGSVAIDNPAGTCTGTCTRDYASATTVHLTAREDISLCTQFDGWTGACSGTSTSCTVNVNGNLTASASFSRIASCNPQ